MAVNHDLSTYFWRRVLPLQPWFCYWALGLLCIFSVSSSFSAGLQPKVLWLFRSKNLMCHKYTLVQRITLVWCSCSLEWWLVMAAEFAGTTGLNCSAKDESIECMWKRNLRIGKSRIRGILNKVDLMNIWQHIKWMRHFLQSYKNYLDLDRTCICVRNGNSVCKTNWVK